MIFSPVEMMGASPSFYAYWQTFDLQRVFPSLRDKFAVFPRATIANQILIDWPTLRSGFTRVGTSEVERRLDSAYGAYLVALSKGAAPYQLKDRAPKFKTVSFIVDQTGIDRATVVAFLSTLEKMAKAGKVDLKYWNPDKAVTLNKEVKRRIQEDVATAPKAPLVEGFSNAFSSLKWLGIGAVVLVGSMYVGRFIPKGKG